LLPDLIFLTNPTNNSSALFLGALRAIRLLHLTKPYSRKGSRRSESSRLAAACVYLGSKD